MDSSLLVLIIVLVISLGVITAFLYFLQPVLHNVCHGEIRASSRATFTRLMQLTSPLLVVRLLSHEGKVK